ncbi:MAG: redoxin family protein [Planctomycetota bacterium]
MRNVAPILMLAVCFVAAGFLHAGDDVVKKKETPAYSFELKDLDGKSFKSADFKDKLIVLEWTESACPAVIPLYKAKKVQNLVAEYKDKGVQWFSVCSTHFNTVEGLKKFAKRFEVSHKILTDFDGKVGKKFGAKRTPHVFIIKNDKILYQGAFDNRRSGENYVKKALDEILANKDVSTPRTKAYG